MPERSETVLKLGDNVKQAYVFGLLLSHIGERRVVLKHRGGVTSSDSMSTHSPNTIDNLNFERLQQYSSAQEGDVTDQLNALLVTLGLKARILIQPVVADRAYKWDSDTAVTGRDTFRYIWEGKLLTMPDNDQLDEQNLIAVTAEDSLQIDKAIRAPAIRTGLRREHWKLAHPNSDMRPVVSLTAPKLTLPDGLPVRRYLHQETWPFGSEYRKIARVLRNII